MSDELNGKIKFNFMELFEVFMISIVTALNHIESFILAGEYIVFHSNWALVLLYFLDIIK